MKNTLCTSYNNIPSTTKTDYTLIPSSFDTSNNILTTSFNHSSHISSPFLTSTSFNKSLYSTRSNFTPTSAANIINSSQVFDNASDDLMTTSFGNISLTESEITVDDQSGNNFDERLYEKSLPNEIPYSFNNSATNVITTCTQDDSFISTPFNKPIYESEDIQSNYLTSCLNIVDNNIMSTSFSTRIANTPISHSNSITVLTANNNSETTSMLRSVKSSKISDKSLSRTLIDTNTHTTDQLPLSDSASNNLMSTSFNYPEGYAIESSDIPFPNTFNNDDQAVKLQHPVTEEKETGVAIPPPPSLISSLTNYLHGLPRKNYPLSKSTQGLSNIKESEKIPSNKTHMPSHSLQKHNSTTSNISENQKTSLSFKTYRYNYDLDYIPFHSTRDDTDLQLSQTVGRKFPSRNFYSSYSTQHGLFENRYSSRSPQINTNINVNRETKMFSNVPPLPVINTSTNSKICSTCPSFVDTPSSLSNEKPKVKFSDTVTHILVPGTVSIVNLHYS